MRTPAPALVERVRCPECGGALAFCEDGGGLACNRGHRASLEAGYLEASANGRADATTEATFASFGYEWNSFDEVRPEDESLARTYFRDLDLAALRDRFGLDAGCGKGRFTRVLARHMAGVVALDGSAAVQAAVRNTSNLDNVLVVKADLRRAPLAEGGFDFVSCLGVLHHLEDPHDGFEALLRYLAPGGQLLLYLYSKPERFGARSVSLAAAGLVRKLTVALPSRLLRVVCVPVSLALYAALVVPGRVGDSLGIGHLSRLPMPAYRDKPWRALYLDTFDRLSAPVEHRFTWPEISWWFEEAGLVVDAAREETGWFVLAHRP